MNIEEDVIETLNKTIKFYGDLDILYNSKEPCPEIRAIRWIITAYEKEKEKNKRLEKFIENGEYTWKQKYNETFEYFKEELEKEKEKNKKLTVCHLQYEEMTGIDLLLPSKEE